ncbi:hypothetical protein I350_05797 [Cryptococcus amylolentus CBS 6273]|uniref:F-box domain-containing protein n=1 Tax=Cryptococcus amylolentus CBS 6273 TaxID=1296118 RepID=A0A1E3JQ25_9TREE|nr:hypothetical protein I350_05797 [Cryptococcus amylolentus CBS 6273]
MSNQRQHLIASADNDTQLVNAPIGSSGLELAPYRYASIAQQGVMMKGWEDASKQKPTLNSELSLSAPETALACRVGSHRRSSSAPLLTRKITDPSSSEREDSRLVDLPPELLMIIIKQLPLSDIMALQQVSFRFHELAKTAGALLYTHIKLEVPKAYKGRHIPIFISKHVLPHVRGLDVHFLDPFSYLDERSDSSAHDNLLRGIENAVPENQLRSFSLNTTRHTLHPTHVAEHSSNKWIQYIYNKQEALRTLGLGGVDAGFYDLSLVAMLPKLEGLELGPVKFVWIDTSGLFLFPFAFEGGGQFEYWPSLRRLSLLRHCPRPPMFYRSVIDHLPPKLEGLVLDGILVPEELTMNDIAQIQSVTLGWDGVARPNRLRVISLNECHLDVAELLKLQYHWLLARIHALDRLPLEERRGYDMPIISVGNPSAFKLVAWWQRYYDGQKLDSASHRRLAAQAKQVMALSKIDELTEEVVLQRQRIHQRIIWLYGWDMPPTVVSWLNARNKWRQMRELAWREVN